MVMGLRLGDLAEDQVAFGCSPAQEALRSLAVLSDVRHHPLHVSWALATRDAMGAELRDEVRHYGFWWRAGPLAFADVWPPDEISSWPDDLARLRAAPAEGVLAPLIHSTLLDRRLGPRVRWAEFLERPDLRERARQRVESRHPPSLTVLAELIADPERGRARFTAFLSSYWEACLAPSWPQRAARLTEDIARRGRALSRRGLARMLAELSPHVSVEPGGADVVIRTPGRRRDARDIEVDLTERDQILLVPSHFVWPELSSTVRVEPADGGERRTVEIVYALAEMQHDGRPPVPPEDLLKLLRSAGDPTRLQILQLLTRRPRSTREIAGLIGLTEAAISKQLKLLQDAGWVSPHRQGYYVYYGLVREAGARLTSALDQLLG